ncbi:MAG: aminomethyl-transferring glycine dehydrogenase subunit GcvPA [Pseudomonadota bacterium]
MPFIPHTDSDIQHMLATIGVDSIDALFDEIPDELRIDALDGIPPGLSEMQVTRLMRERAAADTGLACYIGAGAYEHHIPAAVWQLTTRGEYYSAYTPYQAEASQGTLQVIYEYQSMMAALTGMEVSNASLYDGASAMAEAALMAVRCQRRSTSRTVLCAAGTSDVYRRVAKAIAGTQGLDFPLLDTVDDTGLTDAAAIGAGEPPVAVVIQQPGFHGTLDDVDRLTDAAHAVGALVIAVVNPMSLALLKPPGEWGERGADIVCGEGQPLGVPMSSGGPYFGFLTTRKSMVRQMPGRIVGRTVDTQGRPGFALTLQAREQHIRRSKATSNICTNQGLAVTAATMHMSLLGDAGLEEVAVRSVQGAHRLVAGMTALPGVERVYTAPFFHEATLRLPVTAAAFNTAMAERGFAAGYDIAELDAERPHELLVCVTETKTDADIDAYIDAATEVLNAHG